jgi:hypothetical protein
MCGKRVPIKIHGLEVSFLQNAYLSNFLVSSAMPAGPRYMPVRVGKDCYCGVCAQSRMAVAVAFLFERAGLVPPIDGSNNLAVGSA